MKSFLIVIFWLLFLFLGCDNNGMSSKGSSEMKAVEEFITDYYLVMSARNWTAYRNYFSEKASLTTIWQDSSETKPQLFSSTIEEFISQTANGPDSQPIFEEKPIHIEIEIRGSLAAIWVKYEAKFGSKDKLIEWSGFDLFSLIKYDDKWKIASLTYTEITE